MTVYFGKTDMNPIIKHKMKERKTKAGGRRENRRMVVQNLKESRYDEKHRVDQGRGDSNIQAVVWSFRIKQYII